MDGGTIEPEKSFDIYRAEKIITYKETPRAVFEVVLRENEELCGACGEWKGKKEQFRTLCWNGIVSVQIRVWEASQSHVGFSGGKCLAIGILVEDRQREEHSLGV